ncbi:MAG: hypothetical protein LBP73_00230 [Clostridiales Family XIII bacterium]|jgi:hypothetical protein|nr:hypothetical protein [Clostridiales Family XIII bacterium]
MVGEVNCICSVLEKIEGFCSMGEFERFQRYINGILEDGNLIEVPVKSKYAGFVEQWYKCSDCEQTWRLVHPDFPFKGIWDTVK